MSSVRMEIAYAEVSVILSSIQDHNDSFRTKRRTKREPSAPSSDQAAGNGKEVILCTAHSRLAVFITKGGLGAKEWTRSQGKYGQVLGNEIYGGLLSKQQPHPAQEILCSKNNCKLGKQLRDVSYMLSLLFSKHLFRATEMNTGVDGPLVQPSTGVSTSTVAGLREH